MNKVKVYDVGIIGSGVAGSFAALRAAENFKDKSVAVFELGRRPAKRRRQLEGFLGCFPFGDGKLYTDDTLKVSNIADGRRVKSADKWVMSKIALCGSTKIIKNKEPSITVKNRAEKLDLELSINDYIQWKPESVHKLSRLMSDKFESSSNIEFIFDNEVYQILKKDNKFLVHTGSGDFYCKKILLCVGRSGWRWANDLYKSFGLEIDDSIAKFGITVEMSSQQMKEFNKSHCSFKNDDMEIGPLNWNGTIIPEDHADLVISAFRSNEERWKTEKISFQIIGNRDVGKNNGVKETERLSKLAFLLLNDRVAKEKIKMLVKKKCTLSQLPEYDWLVDVVKKLELLFPNIITKANFHAPTIIAHTGNINISSTLETDVPGLFVAGESANISGLMGAAISGVVAIDSILKA